MTILVFIHVKELPLLMTEISYPATHARMGYPPLPTSLPKLLVVREDALRATDHSLNCDQPDKW